MRTTLEIDTALWKTAKKLAVDEDTTVSALVEEGLKEIIGKHGKDQPTLKESDFGRVRRSGRA